MRGKIDDLLVAFHDGGTMFAGDDREFEPGWYLFNGRDYPWRVVVLKPFSVSPFLPEKPEESDDAGVR